MAEPEPLITITTIIALLAVETLVASAYLLSTLLLPTTTSPKTRILFIWHAFDALVHFILEGSFLYNCFFSYITINHESVGGGGGNVVSPFLPPNTHFLAHKNRLYGPQHGTNFFASLWMDYSKADARWAGTDLSIISLELLTVFVVGPLAVWVCYGLWKGRSDVWFWMLVVAVAELYGGFCTFAPEWLTGNGNLDGSNPLFLWVYLWGFNAGLWVLIPGWVVWEAYGKIVGALGREGRRGEVEGREKVL